jgi:hypothetical protein
MAPRRRTAAELLLLAAAVAACYANALGAPFHLDDEVQIVLNPGIGSWAPSGIEPLTRWFGYLTFKLDARLHGLDPLGFHATNVAIHVLAAFAVYALARLLLSAAGRSDDGRLGTPALAGALLWAVHPLQTQAVTYVVQRLASLTGLLYLGALALYVAARRSETRWRGAAYLAALGAALAATFTKEIAFTLPFAVLLVEAAFLDGAPVRRAASVAPFLALAPVIPLLRLAPAAGSAGLPTDVARVQTDLSRLDYLATQLKVVPTYLRLVVLSVGQNVDWDVPVEHGFGSAAVLLGGALLLALLAAGALLVARSRSPGLRVAGFGILLFFLALSVESSVIPIVDVLFEHRMYLPSAGLALGVAGLASELLARRPAAARFVWGGIAAAAVALGVATVARNAIWRDPVLLWRDAAAKSPNKPRPRFNLGNSYLARGDLADAEREWLRVVALEPTHSAARNQLASLAMTRGDLAGAEVHLRAALLAAFVLPDVYYNLGTVLEATGRHEEALAAWRLFVDRAPPDRAAEVARVRARLGAR